MNVLHHIVVCVYFQMCALLSTNYSFGAVSRCRALATEASRACAFAFSLTATLLLFSLTLFLHHLCALFIHRVWFVSRYHHIKRDIISMVDDGILERTNDTLCTTGVEFPACTLWLKL